ncbi:MAG: hypothetical protein RL215_1982 [Planctomycetota bacterium]
MFPFFATDFVHADGAVIGAVVEIVFTAGEWSGEDEFCGCEGFRGAMFAADFECGDPCSSTRDGAPVAHHISEAPVVFDVEFFEVGDGAVDIFSGDIAADIAGSAERKQLPHADAQV